MSHNIKENVDALCQLLVKEKRTFFVISQVEGDTFTGDYSGKADIMQAMLTEAFIRNPQLGQVAARAAVDAATHTADKHFKKMAVIPTKTNKRPKL